MNLGEPSPSKPEAMAQMQLSMGTAKTKDDSSQPAWVGCACLPEQYRKVDDDQ